MILAIVAMGVFLIGRWDEPLSLKSSSRLWILAGAAAEFGGIMAFTGDRPGHEKFFWAVFGGSLLLACVTDSLLCQVYNFTWWISSAAALALLWCRRAVFMESRFIYFDALGGLLFFVGLQLLLRGRIYGCADSYAFCVCALAQTALGISTAGFLTHMLLAYLLLFVIQLFRRNLNRKGNLRQPVPFLPYITAAFWITLALHSAGGGVML